MTSLIIGYCSRCVLTYLLTYGCSC